MAAVAARKKQWDALNIKFLAVSTDSIYSHKISIQTTPAGRTINFPLLSDRTQQVSRRYGVLNEKEGFAYRAAFIIDPEGNIRGIIINPQPVGRNIDEIIRIIQGLQYNLKTGLGVPAGWQPGEQGIPTGWDYVGKY